YYKKDINTFEHISVDILGLNDIGYAKLVLSKKTLYDNYHTNKETGRFIIIEKYSNKTVGAGMIMQQSRGKKEALKYSDFEIDFNALVRKYFPHWEAKEIIKTEDFQI
ncbi:MAG: sulfate adenylyltransferase subunit CysN, partial [Epsilonproteobacteria bacterium]|nr:sulfate adenylyltransferase subunit CysN [Campylobacterota bacterium]